MTTPYDEDFYNTQNLASARAVLPVLFEAFRPGSVIDVGCGSGTWLAACRELGVADMLGLDGTYVRADILKIPAGCFRATDLREPVRVDRTFDLAMCLEVAEHLPLAHAPRLVEDLTRLADVVLFSAAIPYQTGTAHVNENWQQFWAELFRERGFRHYDLIRPRVWDDPRVEFWYRQNLLVYAREARQPALLPGAERAPSLPLSVVHPEMLLHAVARGTVLSATRLARDLAYLRSFGRAPAERAGVAPVAYGPLQFFDFRDFSVRQAAKKLLSRAYNLGAK